MKYSRNHAQLIGRVKADPVISEVGQEKLLKAEFVLATDESYYDNDGQKVEKTEWHNIQFLGKQAKQAQGAVFQGDLVLVNGKLVTESWEKDGEKNYVYRLKPLSFDVLARKKEREEQAQA